MNVSFISKRYRFSLPFRRRMRHLLFGAAATSLARVALRGIEEMLEMATRA